jgi:hypothetical protein
MFTALLLDEFGFGRQWRVQLPPPVEHYKSVYEDESKLGERIGLKATVEPYFTCSERRRYFLVEVSH